jgi:hypothetical protein
MQADAQITRHVTCISIRAEPRQDSAVLAPLARRGRILVLFVWHAVIHVFLATLRRLLLR